VRPRLAATVAAGTALAVLAPLALGAGDIDPVRMSVVVPSKIYAGQHRTIRVTVDADSGAFDIAALPIKAQVKLATTCKGTFEDTHGRTIIDKAIRPQPTKGSDLAASASSKVSFSKRRSYEVCAFVTDAEMREFATDVDHTITVRKKPRRH